MIPTIGIVMIGLYIMTRCAEMISTARLGESPRAVMMMAALTFLTALLGILYLIVSGAGSDLAAMLPALPRIPE